MLPESAVARCECGGLVFPESVEQVRREDESAVLLVWAHECGGTGEVRMLMAPYLAFVEAWRAGRARRARADRLGFDPEVVGRVVQGWRIELDAIRVPADLVWFWADQERREPWSVRREH